MIKFFKLGKEGELPVKSVFFEDNNGCISTCTTLNLSPRTKHIAVKYYFTRAMFSCESQVDHPYVIEKLVQKNRSRHLH